MQENRPFVMSIAGFDPSGGAGLLADAKTFEQLQVQGFGVCTAMTIQTEFQCLHLEWQSLETIRKSINVLMENYPVEAVKIGVVKDAKFLNEIIKIIKANNRTTKIVWDPVLKSSSEFSFFDLNTVQNLKAIIHQIDIITPNYHEYELLNKFQLFENDDNFCSVLVKGGHRDDYLGTDILVKKGKKITITPTEKALKFYPKHGSGCVLSSAIASYLAKGENIENACRKGKLYIEKFLTSNSTLLGFHT